MLGEAALALLAEDQLPVGENVELALLAGDNLCLVRRFPIELGRETRSPAVIAVSDGAVIDLDVCHQMVLNCSKGCLQAWQ